MLDRMRRLLYLRPIRGRAFRIAFALGLTTVVTLVGKGASSTTTTSAAMYYLLAVVVSSFLGSLWGGLTAALGSFLALNFFFTPPFGTFRVAKVDDLIALFVFFVVASLVAALLAEVLEQRTRAERRERETSLLYQLSSNLLSRERLDAALNQVAKDLTDLFDLQSSKVVLRNQDSGTPAESNSLSRVELRTGANSYGYLHLYPKEDRALNEIELDLARAFATQVALAVEAARLNEESRRARDEAEVSRIRAALFSSVTHDLKTPLSVVKASASSLLEEGVVFDPERRHELLKTIVEETDRLNRLISNLLQLSRLRAGVLIPHKTPTPIGDVIASVLARLGSFLDEKNIVIETQIREDLPSVPMDVIQIDQALSNVLENARRYAPSGTSVKLIARPWQSWIEVLVADRGRGIPAAEREKVFEEFYRGEKGDSKGNAGLGLAIVKAIVTAHGGSVWVEETPGGGATIGFRLPLSLDGHQP
ncbi:MAG: ATP-binding protein [Actinomycetota bacterium]